MQILTFWLGLTIGTIWAQASPLALWPHKWCLLLAFSPFLLLPVPKGGNSVCRSNSVLWNFSHYPSVLSALGLSSTVLQSWIHNFIKAFVKPTHCAALQLRTLWHALLPWQHGTWMFLVWSLSLCKTPLSFTVFLPLRKFVPVSMLDVVVSQFLISLFTRDQNISPCVNPSQWDTVAAEINVPST